MNPDFTSFNSTLALLTPDSAKLSYLIILVVVGFFYGVFGLLYIYQTWLLRKSCNHLATIETTLLAVLEKTKSSQASDRSPTA
jgi:hypothetical protein